MLKTDYLIRTSSKGLASFDDVAVELLKKAQSEAIRQVDWVGTVARYLGTDMAVKVLQGMLDGELVTLDKFWDGHVVLQADKEAFEIGFIEVDSIVAIVTPGSRAAAAGIQKGDEILQQTVFTTVFQNLEEMNVVKLRRGKQILDTSYWPRSREKVSCWEIHEKGTVL